MDITSPFSAVDSLSGYLFQVRYGLLEALKRLKTETAFSISIETIDDIVFEPSGKPVELLQTKHHSNPGNITDSSTDLWKTIRIWSEQHKKGLRANYYLVTTAKALDGSIAYYLKTDKDMRNVSKAISRLDAVASSSTNAENLAGYTVFQSLTRDEKDNLFASVIVLDSTPTILNLDDELTKEVFYAVERRFLGSFIVRLEGWWYRRALLHLTKDKQAPILGEEIIAELGNLREQFKRDNLVIDDDIVSATINESEYQDRIFVQQLKLIDVNNKRIFIAIRDYFRAFQQRSRWIREDLLQVGELDRYEKRLTEEWEIRFEQMRDQLGEETADKEKKQLAQDLYSWVEIGVLHQIRAQVNEPSMARGSYHILSDNKSIGWHPEFTERLMKLLGTSV
jgi:hypothetical protein